MTKRNVLVLGGTAYFGKHLIKMLLTNGDNVCVVTRGNNEIPVGCSFIKFDRSKSDDLVLDGYWDVVYDQSCYSSNYLAGLKNIITNCGLYILTSSQSVYPAGEAIEESSIDYSDISYYKNIINDYGYEKLKSEYIVQSLTKKYVFPRFPVVIGSNDPRRRIQNLAENILKEYVCLPANNPTLQILDEFDAAKALFEIPFKNINGPINIASKEAISAEDLCQMIADIVNANLKIKKSVNFRSASFDLIKAESKSLRLKKQETYEFNVSNLGEILENIISPIHSMEINLKCRL